MIPKISTDKDVIKIERIVNQIEKNKIKKKVGFELVIESAEFSKCKQNC